MLTQGIQNANNGLATLQTIDGGMSNISQLLDRARTLATQSASGTFTGSRTVLDNEFQSVLTEIDRQAQSIGMNAGGHVRQEPCRCSSAAAATRRATKATRRR